MMESVTTFAGETWKWCRSSIPSLVWPDQPVAAATPPPAAAVGTQTSGSGCGALKAAAGGGSGGDVSRFVRVGSPFVRLAGLSGAAAVALGAYGAHSFSADKADLKRVYDTANFYHFVHTLALLAVPMTRRPVLTGTLMISGTALFCGTIYYHALTEERSLRRFTPYGGILLMMAWVSMAL